MATPVASDDTKKRKPSASEIATFKGRTRELRERFFAGVLNPKTTNDGLQSLMEMTRGCINCNAQPNIPFWAHKGNPIEYHIPCGMVDPSKLRTSNVVGDGEEYILGEELLARAQKLNSMNACAFDFYSQPQNWKYLPTDPQITIIVFPKTVFLHLSGVRYFHTLLRLGEGWGCGYHWGGDRASRHFLVAVLGK